MKQTLINSFLDGIEIINKKYIHMDLKVENVVFTLNEENLNFKFIDMDGIIKRDNIKNVNDIAWTGKTGSLETCELYLMKNNNDEKKLIMSLKDKTKLNYVGILDVILCILHENNIWEDIFYAYVNYFDPKHENENTTQIKQMENFKKVYETLENIDEQTNNENKNKFIEIIKIKWNLQDKNKDTYIDDIINLIFSMTKPHDTRPEINAIKKKY